MEVDHITYARIIGHRIRVSREDLGLSQDDLAKQLNVNINLLSRLERGTFSYIRLVLFKQLIDALNIDPGELLQWPAEPKG